MSKTPLGKVLPNGKKKEKPFIGNLNFGERTIFQEQPSYSKMLLNMLCIILNNIIVFQRFGISYQL